MKPISVTILSTGLIVATAAIGAEGRFPIYAPTTITLPGSYIVTRDILATGPTGIVIDADNVTLELNDHTLTGESTTILVSIPSTSAARQIVVRNGRLWAAKKGVLSLTTDVGLRLEALDIRGTTEDGIRVDDPRYVQIIGCRVVDTVTGLSNHDAIRLAGAVAFTAEVTNNLIESTPYNAIRMSNAFAGQITRNTIRKPNTNCSSCGYGILLNGNGVLIAESVITGAKGAAMAINGNGIIVRNNTVQLNLEGGINISGIGNQILENAVAENGDGHDGPFGINVGGAGSVVRGNVVRGTSGHGISVSGTEHVIEENASQGSGPVEDWCGIFFSNAGNHVYRNNVIRGNAGGAVCGAANTDAGGNVL